MILLHIFFDHFLLVFINLATMSENESIEDLLDMDMLCMQTPQVDNPTVYNTKAPRMNIPKSPVHPPCQKQAPKRAAVKNKATTRSQTGTSQQKEETTNKPGPSRTRKRPAREPGPEDSSSDEDINPPQTRKPCACGQYGDILSEMRNYLGTICEQMEALQGVIAENARKMSALTEAVSLNHVRVEALQANVTRTVTSTAPIYPDIRTYAPTAHQPAQHKEQAKTDNEAPRAKRLVLTQNTDKPWRNLPGSSRTRHSTIKKKNVGTRKGMVRVPNLNNW